MEDYLEPILNLEKEKKAVRVKDIARKMEVKLPKYAQYPFPERSDQS
jgi:Mn-dependent DtxR family transcriptional regulator